MVQWHILLQRNHNDYNVTPLRIPLPLVYTVFFSDNLFIDKNKQSIQLLQAQKSN